MFHNNLDTNFDTQEWKPQRLTLPKTIFSDFKEAKTI